MRMNACKTLTGRPHRSVLTALICSFRNASTIRLSCGSHQMRLLTTPTGGCQRLAVFVGSAASYHEQRLPVAGRDERDGQFLRFTPAFGFVAGQEYVVRTRRSGEPDRLTEFRIPREVAAAPALVTGVYPSGDVLPENVLRFYVHFSVPMTPHLASDFVAPAPRIRPRRSCGIHEVQAGAVERGPDAPHGLDRPGPHQAERGHQPRTRPSASEGQRYELTVDEGWPAADGSSVLPSFSKRVQRRRRPEGAAQRRSGGDGDRLDLEHASALRIVFDRPFDRHLLDDALHVVDGDGQPIDGTPLPGDTRRRGRSHPPSPGPQVTCGSSSTTPSRTSQGTTSVSCSIGTSGTVRHWQQPPTHQHKQGSKANDLGTGERRIRASSSVVQDRRRHGIAGGLPHRVHHPGGT